jgi:hypothetical protein
MYKLISNPMGEINSVLRLSDRACIPFAEGNADYEIYLKWLDGYEYDGMFFNKVSEGNTPEAADPLPEIGAPVNDVETLQRLLKLLEEQTSNTSSSGNV